MEYRNLGNEGFRSSAIGLGCMGMSWAYGNEEAEDAAHAIRLAVDLGVTMFDTADSYGPGTNERLLGESLAAVRDAVVIATKFGNVRDSKGSLLGIDGRPEYVRQACDASLTRLGIDTIDLYYRHTMDPSVPIEETVGAMSELVTEGKVRSLGLSNTSATEIRKAHAVFPITAVQEEYSLWTREVENEILPTLRELGIGLVAYSPLGRGFLTGAIRARNDLQQGDFRLDRFPRFTEKNLAENLRLLEALEGLAGNADATLSQVSLAWVLAQGSDIVPIPGTTNPSHLEENLASVVLPLSSESLEGLGGLLDHYEIAGDASPPAAG